ncbi:hypothetical protein [Streptomyces tailanensis]|uniref:hypothetical protein n=1 Tax=Streptomyces tailanensis TaxID=2569858 RepID=UPI00319E9D81
MSAKPWLPQPDWNAYTAEADQADRTSMLQLYRSALRLRRTHPNLRGEKFRWLDSPPGTLLFERGTGLLYACRAIHPGRVTSRWIPVSTPARE